MGGHEARAFMKWVVGARPSSTIKRDKKTNTVYAEKRKSHSSSRHKSSKSSHSSGYHEPNYSSSSQPHRHSYSGSEYQPPNQPNRYSDFSRLQNGPSSHMSHYPTSYEYQYGSQFGPPSVYNGSEHALLSHSSRPSFYTPPNHQPPNYEPSNYQSSNYQSSNYQPSSGLSAYHIPQNQPPMMGHPPSHGYASTVSPGDSISGPSSPTR
ncbi:hypothetical protein F4859DRAFT_509933 [Xylaria cf. heliscus]|nr:hypothetical protein F4859DRAFT_509933 [Xylaria cf. heliscus]